MDLIEFWFNNPDYWFNPNHEYVDNIITKKYGYSINHLLKDDNTTNSKFHNILVLDQLSRHIHRGDTFIIKQYTNKAITIAIDCLTNNLDFELPIEQRCFMMMPLRHSFHKDLLLACIKRVHSYKKWNEIPFAVRFYKASIKSLGNIYNNELCISEYTNLDTNLYIDICDHYGYLYDKFDKQDMLSNYITDYKDKNICVSLSGGVDSMVCLYLLKKNNYNVSAVHINYMNRDTAIKEEEFVNTFCNQLKVPLYIRRITEIKRTRDFMREFYETYTKSVRFESYKKTKCDYIVLGHNKDDCIENMFSNICKNRNYKNLYGMDILHTENDVKIWRPLLNISKHNIVRYAQRHGISYLYDSTNSWCERGKMRDQLIPYVDRFNNLLIPGMENLVKEMNEQKELIKKNIYNPFYEKIIWEKDYVEMPYTNINVFTFWQELLIKIAVYLNVKYPSKKAIESFVNMKELTNINIRKIHLSKGFTIIKTNTTIRVN